MSVVRAHLPTILVIGRVNKLFVSQMIVTLKTFLLIKVQYVVLSIECNADKQILCYQPPARLLKALPLAKGVTLDK